MVNSKISQKLLLATLTFSLFGSFGSQQLAAMNQVAEIECAGAGPAQTQTSTFHIAHKTMLDVLKRRNLDLEEMWDRLDIDKDWVGKEVVTVGRSFLNMLNPIIDIEKAYGEKLCPDSIVPEIPIAGKILNFFALLEGKLCVERLPKELNLFSPTELGKSMKQEFIERCALGKEGLFGGYSFYSRKVKNLALHDFLTDDFGLRIMNFDSGLINRIEQDYGMHIINADKPLQIECINKIKVKGHKRKYEMFHSVSLDNIAAKPSHILQALGLVMAYHFTQESLQKRKKINDYTLQDIPFLVIRITQHEPTDQVVNPKKIALELRREKKLPSTLACPDLKSEFYDASDERVSQFNQPDCQLFQETALSEPGIFCKAAVVCAVFLNPLAAGLNALIPFSAEVKTEDTSQLQSVCFTTEQNTQVCCDLNQDLSLTCCNQDIPTQCISFNMLNNDDPLHNCCTANTQGVACSMDLCSDSNAIVGPCSNGGELVNKTIDQTYGSQHHEFANTLNTISKSKNFTDNEITLVRSRAQGVTHLTVHSDLTTRQDAIGTLVRYIRYLEKNLKISPDRKVRTITINNVYDYAATNHTGDQTLYLNSQLSWLPSLDYVLGHEIAHNYQAQLLKASNNLKLLFLKPGFEISADILGSLASNHSNLATVGAQWLNVDVDNSDTCAIELPIINHENAETIRNLMGSSILRILMRKESPHPDSPIRGTILLKLNTMIKAAVKYLEQIAQCPTNQSNNTQITTLNSNI